MLEISEIKSFIEEDRNSRKKRDAEIGIRYYESNHDIKQYRIFYFDADGNLKEDKTRSNIKISHSFFTELVDQCTQYMLSGKNGFVKSDDPELQAHLNDYFNDNEDFMAELYEVVTGCQTKGFEYMYAFKDKDSKISFQCADSLGVVECEAKYTSDGMNHLIFWYVEKVDKNNKKIKRIQVWDEAQVTYYTQIDDGAIVLDEAVQPNPRPHTIWKDDSGQTYGEAFGVIPFFRIDFNRKQFSALKPIKPLIDDYDLMNAGLSNNIQDSVEALYVVKGFQGDNLDELMTNIRAKKHIGVDDDGGIEVHTVAIPTEARKIKMEVDEKNIYRFGMGFNSAQLGDGNITNIVIKSRYALLDLKCNKLEIKLKQFMRKLLKLVLKEINDENGTDYQQDDVYFSFDREIMTNASDNAQIEYVDAQKQNMQITTLLNLAQHLDNETLMQQICDVLDLDYEKIKDKLPDPEMDPLTMAQEELDDVKLVDEDPEGDEV